MQILLAAILVIAAALLWATNLLGLPGNWLVLGIVITYAYYTEESRLDVGWMAVAAMFALAALGELLEFVAAALGAAKAGASRRGVVLAFVGSVVGGLAGAFAGVGVPIPVIGSLVGALVLAGVGALAGAFVGEQWKGRDLDTSLKIGHAAFWGRLVGTAGKVIVGLGMVGVLMTAILL